MGLESQSTTLLHFKTPTSPFECHEYTPSINEHWPLHLLTRPGAHQWKKHTQQCDYDAALIPFKCEVAYVTVWWVAVYAVMSQILQYHYFKTNAVVVFSQLFCQIFALFHAISNWKEGWLYMDMVVSIEVWCMVWFYKRIVRHLWQGNTTKSILEHCHDWAANPSRTRHVYEPITI